MLDDYKEDPDKFSVNEIYNKFMEIKKRVKKLHKNFGEIKRKIENLKKFSTQFYKRFLKNQNPHKLRIIFQPFPISNPLVGVSQF